MTLSKFFREKDPYSLAMLRLAIEEAERKIVMNEAFEQRRSQERQSQAEAAQRLAASDLGGVVDGMLARGRQISKGKLEAKLAHMHNIMGMDLFLAAEPERIIHVRDGVLVNQENVAGKLLGNAVLFEFRVGQARLSARVLVYYNEEGTIEKVFLQVNRGQGEFMFVELDPALSGAHAAIIKAIKDKFAGQYGKFEDVRKLAEPYDEDNIKLQLLRPAIHDQASRNHMLEFFRTHPSLEMIYYHIENLGFAIPENIVVARNLERPGSKGFVGGIYHPDIKTVFTKDKVMIFGTFLHEMLHRIYDHLMAENEEQPFITAATDISHPLFNPLAHERVARLRSHFTADAPIMQRLSGDLLYKDNKTIDNVNEAFAYTLEALLMLREGTDLRTMISFGDVRLFVELGLLPEFMYPEEAFDAVSDNECITNVNYYYKIIEHAAKSGNMDLAERSANSLCGRFYLSAVKLAIYLHEHGCWDMAGRLFERIVKADEAGEMVGSYSNGQESVEGKEIARTARRYLASATPPGRSGEEKLAQDAILISI